MANISQNVNIEMLEKLADGTYKRKYPKTRSDTGVTFDEHLAEKATGDKLGHVKVDGITIFANNEGCISLNPNLIIDPTGSPGPKNLISGTMALGFFGEVSAAELITGNNLASQTGITRGSAQFSDTPWLKFASEGKILFVAKKSIRSKISWDAINTAKCVYGDEGDKVIVQNSHSYKVRLLKGANPVFNPKAPIKGQANGGNGYNGEVNHLSEWNKLICAVHKEAPTKAWAYPNNVEATLEVLTHDLGSGANGMYTDQDLHTHDTHGDGTYCWCQEMTSSTSICLYRGNSGVSYASDYTSSYASANMGWRPVLEFVA